MASLAVPGALSSSQRTVCVCVWPVGTGTADPPLTPGGVYRAMEEEEWRVECGVAMAVSERSIPFRPEKGGGHA